MKKDNLTYQKSGVNIKAADKFVKYIASKVKETQKSVNFKNIGGFGAILKIPNNKKFYIVTSTDGVGTKLEIANKLNKFNTIGIDLVAMSANDLIVQGATPYYFLDYISIDKIKLNKLKQIMDGIVKGCKLAKCELVGGETAEMPGTYTKGKFDIAGCAIGFVKKREIINKKNVRKNNIVLAIPSSGLHANGYSLVRKLIKKNKISLSNNVFLIKELIKPTKIYVNEILKLSKNNLINSCANITGGGLEDNLKRAIPEGYCAEIDMSKIKTKKIFSWIKSHGISDFEMYKTFNCGVGFCLIIDPKNFNKVRRIFKKEFKPYVIGEITKSKNLIKLKNKILIKPI